MTSIAAALRVADRLLDQGAGRGHPVVGRERGDEDDVDVVGLEAGDRDRALAGDRRQRGRRLVRRRRCAARGCRCASTIHSSDVSTTRSRSALVSTRSGAYMPQPVMRTLVGRHRLHLDQRLLRLDQRAALGVDAHDPAGPVALDLVEQLHRLDQADHLADVDLRRRRARRARRRARATCRRARSAVRAPRAGGGSADRRGGRLGSCGRRGAAAAESARARRRLGAVPPACAAAPSCRRPRPRARTARTR